MLWRVRARLADRPGTLAALAHTCGEAGVNILGLQIFPGVDSVTDELVLRTPDAWRLSALAAIVEESGGEVVSAAPCTEAALIDQPTRFVQATRTMLAQPTLFPQILAELFDAESDPVDEVLPASPDVLEVRVAEVSVQIRRAAPFTGTELARAEALADLVTDVLARSHADSAVPLAGRRTGPWAAPDYVVGADRVTAEVEGTVVGLAVVRPEAGEPGVREVALSVDLAWQRRGIGTRLLKDVARLAGSLGASEIVLTARPDNAVVLPLILASGLRSRIQMTADRLVARAPVGQPAPAAT